MSVSPPLDFQAIFEAQPEPMVLVRGDALEVVTCTVGYLRAVGKEREALCGRLLRATEPWCNEPRSLKAIEDVHRIGHLNGRGCGGPLPSIETGAEGGRWNGVLASPMGSETTRLMFHCTHSPQASRAKITHWEKLFDQATHSLLVLSDGDGAVFYVNRSVEWVLGHTVEEYLARPAPAWVHPDDLRELQAKSEALYRYGGVLQARVRVRERNGDYRIMDITVRNLLSDPDVGAVVTHAYDVTSYVGLQKELERVNTYLNQALVAAKAMGWDWDLELDRQRFLSDPTAFFGMSPDKICRGGASDDNAAEGHEALRGRVAALGVGEDFEHAFSVMDETGQIRYFLMRGRMLSRPKDSAGRLSGVILDVTAQRRLAIEHEHIERRIQQSQKIESLGVLAGGVAHDFNNILMAILGNASLAKLFVDEQCAATDHLREIEEAVARASDLCRQMLAYAGKGRFVVAPINLNRLIEETVQLLKVSVTKKSVLRLSLDPRIGSVMGDSTQLRQVLMNIVINASDALGERSGVISINTGMIRIERSYTEESRFSDELPEGLYVTLEVSDTGEGMTPESQERMFEPFFSTKQTGRGLGLAAVLGIIRGHRGAVRVYSEVGVGTSFKVLFPAHDGVSASPCAPPAAPSVRTREGLVLVVDDEEAVRRAASGMLMSLGFRVIMASDGLEALERFREHAPDIVCVLMDLTMPHLDGEETFRELRREWSDVKVLLMSGYNEQDAVARFVGKGLAGFIQKPFDRESLQARLFALLDAPCTGPGLPAED